jgi:hypothetical protein
MDSASPHVAEHSVIYIFPCWSACVVVRVEEAEGQTSEETAWSMAIHASFYKAGMAPARSARPFRFIFEEERIREDEGFMARQNRGLNVEELSRRRYVSRFRIMNARMRKE